MLSFCSWFSFCWGLFGGLNFFRLLFFWFTGYFFDWFFLSFFGFFFFRRLFLWLLLFCCFFSNWFLNWGFYLFNGFLNRRFNFCHNFFHRFFFFLFRLFRWLLLCRLFGNFLGWRYCLQGRGYSFSDCFLSRFCWLDLGSRGFLWLLFIIRRLFGFLLLDRFDSRRLNFSNFWFFLFAFFLRLLFCCFFGW